jgi:hypothetical protein
MSHPLSHTYADLFSFTITGADGNPLAAAPISIAPSGASCLITPLSPGECFINVQNGQALYPLSVLVRVIEHISSVYIEPSSSLIQIAGATSRTVSVSLVNLPDALVPSPDFEWSIPQNDIIDAQVFNGDSEGKGDQIWITGKKQGSLKLSVAHPLSPLPRDIIVMVTDIPAEASDAATFISTGQNFIRTKVGAADTTVSITLNNATDSDLKDLSWHIDNAPADASSAPVIAYIAGSGSAHTGSPSANSRSAALLVPIASGFATIAPLRAGSATITISHPKALYSTKILVSVLDAGAKEEPSLVLFSSLAVPYVTLKNGDSAVLSVSLSGSGKTPDDDDALLWRASAGLSLSASGSSASVTAAGSGVSRETVSVSHPKARLPFDFTVLRYDTDEQLYSAKTLFLQDRYRVLPKGATERLSASIIGAQDGDSLSWNVSSGSNSVIAFDQLSNSQAEITALRQGSASVSVSFAGQSDSFEITVIDDTVVDVSKPSYLSTSDNVTLLSIGDGAAVSVLPVNISASHYGDILWSTRDTALIDLIPNGDTATVFAKAEGKAAVSVSHPSSANTLELFVHIGGRYEYKSTDFSYISTSSDTFILRSGGESVLLQPVLVSTDQEALRTADFSFSVKDSSVASLETTGDAAIVSPKRAGQTLISISHPLAAFSKDIIVIVDNTDRNTPYITTAQNVVTVLQGDYAAVSATLANAPSTSSADWSWTVQDTSVASVIAGGATAMLAGITPGSTLVTVANKNAPLPLSIILITIDRQSAAQKPWIKTSANIITVKNGASITVSADMIGGAPTDNHAFIWSTSDPLTVLLSPSQNQLSLRGLKAGHASVSVRNANHQDAYSKTILVIVEDAVLDECSISLNQQIVKLKPDDTSGVTVKAALLNGGPLDAQHFIWWADDYNIIALSSITDSALILPTGLSGSTTVHVKHPKALYTADIVVLVGAFDDFAFSSPSISIGAGSSAFIPLRIPALNGKPAVTFSSANTAIAAVSGSSSVAMIAGLKPGSTTVTATLNSPSGFVASADLAVIVSPPAPNPNAVSSPSSLLTIEYNRSVTVSAALTGPDALPSDKWNLSWLSGDPNVVSVTANGDTAVFSAESPGETVVYISHQKAPAPFAIWVRVPDVKEKSLSLDRSFIELFRNEGNATITATVYNGSSADYNAISWSAPRQSGAQIVSLMNTSGKSCTVIPRNAGTTALSAQLPDGQKAECLINVTSDALLSLNTQTIRVNPRYSETARYTVLPENAAITWFAQADNAVNHSSVFDYSVDPNEKTITITGNNLGSGTINGYISSTAGAKMVALRVYVEHTYLFSFTNSTYRSKHRPDETSFTYTFKVFPPDLEIKTASSRPDILSVPPAATVDPATGVGSLVCTPLGEAKDVSLSFTGYLPGSATPIPEASGERIVDVVYDAYNIEAVFSGIKAGAFSRYDKGTLYLGDGEEMTFSVRATDKYADLTITGITWTPPDGNASPDAKSVAAGGNISLSTDAPNRFRIKHASDYTSGDYFLITKDLYYTLDAVDEELVNEKTYDDKGEVISSTQKVVKRTNPTQTLSAKNGQGITGWYAEHGDSTSGWSESSKPFLHVNGSSNDCKRIIDAWLRSNRAASTDVVDYPAWNDGTKLQTSWTIGSYYTNTYQGPNQPPTQTLKYLYKNASITFSYSDAAPYVISGNAFHGNPNYYRGELSERKHHWDLSGDHYAETFYFRATKLHRYAFPTTTKNESLTQTIAGGKIRITYTPAGGGTKTADIPVVFEKRDCEAYGKGLWIQSGSGWIQSK